MAKTKTQQDKVCGAPQDAGHIVQQSQQELALTVARALGLGHEPAGRPSYPSAHEHPAQHGCPPPQVPRQRHGRSLIYRTALAGWGPLPGLRIGQHPDPPDASPPALSLPDLPQRLLRAYRISPARLEPWLPDLGAGLLPARHAPERAVERPAWQAAWYHAAHCLVSGTPDSGDVGG